MAIETRFFTLSATFFIALATLSGVSSVAHASAEEAILSTQPTQAAGDEIEALKTKIAELERQLTAAKQTISILRRRLAQQGISAAEDEEDPLILPEDQPLASPDTLLTLVTGQYADFCEGKNWDDIKARRTFLRDAERWISRVEKDHRGRFEWTCDIISREQLTSGEEYLMVVIRDPETGDRWSEQFEIEVPRRLQARVRRLPADEPVMVHGAFQLDLVLNREREDQGAFNSPRFVGPFVEFGFRLEISAIASIENEDDDQGHGTTGG